MATKVGEVFYEIGAKLDKFNAGMKSARGKADELSSNFDKSTRKVQTTAQNFQSTMLKAAAAASSLYVVYNKLIKPASALEEATSKFNVVFASTTRDMSAAVDVLVESYAMSTREARQNLASVQDLLVPMGMLPDAAAKMSEEVVKLAADLGSFNDLPTAQVMGDIQSALVGNFETMKKYGVVLNETVIKQAAMSMGLFDGKGQLDANTKAQVAFKLAMEGSAAAQGDMIRTSDSFANVMKKIGAAVEDMGAEIGSELLPGLSSLGNAFLDLSKDGGILFDTLKFIATSVGWLIEGLANMIRLVDSINLDQKTAGLSIIQSELNKQYEHTFKLVEDIYGKNAISKLQKHAAETGRGSSRARELLKTLQETSKHRVDISGKLAKISADQIKNSEAVHGKEKEQIQESIKARESEKKNVEDTKNVKVNTSKEFIKARDKFESEWNKKLAEHGKTEVEILKMTRDKALAEAEKFGSRRAAIAKFYNEEIERAQFESLAKTATMYIDSFTKIGSAIKDLYMAFGATREQDINDRYDKLTSAEVEYNAFLTEKEKERYDGLSESEKKEYDLRVKADESRVKQEKKKAKELKKLHQEQAIVQKIAALFSIAADAAKGIMSAIAAFWFTGGQPWVSIIGATAALQAAAVLAAPLPRAKDGIFADTPFIGGEAGPELAFPLASSQGQKAMELFAGKLIGEISARENVSPATTNTTINEIATVEPTDTGSPLHLVVNIGEDKIYDNISDAINNRQIIIDV